MSKIQRSDFITRHGRAVDLQKLERSESARTELADAGLEASQLRSADLNQDGRLSAAEAWKVADDLDHDGSRRSLIDVDAAGTSTPAGKAVSALGLLLHKRELQAEAASSASRRRPPGPEQLRALGQELRDLPSQLVDGRLALDPQLLDRVERDYGPAGRERLDSWQQLSQELEGKSDKVKINRVDNFFHELIRYKSDRSTSGVREYWQSPIETLASGRGDCEDYALAKYVTLRQLGLPLDSVRMAAVVTPEGTSHAVTLADPGDGQGPLVLDNQRLFALRLSQRDDLTPLFVVSERGGQSLDASWQPLVPIRFGLGHYPHTLDALRRSLAVLPADAVERIERSGGG